MPTPPPPANRPACDPEFAVPPTLKLYYLRNKNRPHNNLIRAEITDLGYFAYEVRNEPDDGRGCPGGWLFECAWNHFAAAGVSIRGIRGAWSYGDNLLTVNNLTKYQQMPIEDAAQRTWAFAQASKKGFSKVKVLDSNGTPGNYSSIDVVFLP